MESLDQPWPYSFPPSSASGGTDPLILRLQKYGQENIDDIIARLKTELVEAKAMLKVLEWVGGCHNLLACPICAHLKQDGHMSLCKLNAILNKP